MSKPGFLRTLLLAAKGRYSLSGSVPRSDQWLGEIVEWTNEIAYCIEVPVAVDRIVGLSVIVGQGLKAGRFQNHQPEKQLKLKSQALWSDMRTTELTSTKRKEKPTSAVSRFRWVHPQTVVVCPSFPTPKHSLRTLCDSLFLFYLITQQ